MKTVDRGILEAAYQQTLAERGEEASRQFTAIADQAVRESVMVRYLIANIPEIGKLCEAPEERQRVAIFLFGLEIGVRAAELIDLKGLFALEDPR